MARKRSETTDTPADAGPASFLVELTREVAPEALDDPANARILAMAEAEQESFDDGTSPDSEPDSEGDGDPYAEGVDAFLAGDSDTANPYPPATDKHLSWNDGYNANVDEDDETE